MDRLDGLAVFVTIIDAGSSGCGGARAAAPDRGRDAVCRGEKRGGV